MTTKKEQKILIVIPRYSITNNNFTNEINYNYNFPLGLGYISSVLKQTDYHVDCLNLNHHKGYIEDIVTNALCKHNYDYVCTGHVSAGYRIIEKIINTVHIHKSRPKTILGGIIVTSEPELMFNSLNPDYIVIGEGENTIIELLEYLEHKGNIEEVDGIGYRDKNDNIVFTKQRKPITDLSILPIPDFEGFEFEKKLKHQHTNDNYFNNVFDIPRAYPIMGSRGCPFQCSFCYHYNKFIERTIISIMEELNIMVKQYKINTVVLYDDCFSTSTERIYEFCEGINKLKKEITWDLKWTCAMTVKTLDKEILKMMKDSGCDVIGYGFESYSSSVLKSMKKPITPQLIDHALHETLDAGIALAANFIFGDIAETTETSNETLEYWKKNCKGQVAIFLIMPYPGSAIYNHCIEKGIIKDKLDFIKNDIIVTTFNMTNTMTCDEFEQLKNKMANYWKSYQKHVVPLSIKQQRKNTYTLKIKCPFCKKINVYNNCFIENKLMFGFNLICRSCPMRFEVESFLQNIRTSKPLHILKKLILFDIFYLFISKKIRRKLISE